MPKDIASKIGKMAKAAHTTPEEYFRPSSSDRDVDRDTDTVGAKVGRMAKAIGTTPERLMAPSRDQNPPSFKHGGRVKKTGIYRLHRGEKVVPTRRNRRDAGRQSSRG